MLDEFDVTAICVVSSYGGTIEDGYKMQKYYFEEYSIRWFIENAESEEAKEMMRSGREYLVENLTKEKCIEKYKKAILES